MEKIKSIQGYGHTQSATPSDGKIGFGPTMVFEEQEPALMLEKQEETPKGPRLEFAWIDNLTRREALFIMGA